MENNQAKKMSVRLLAVITTPKLADKTADMFKKEALPLQYRFSAEGTAPNAMMDMLGLGSIDKCVLLTAVPKSLALSLLKKLHIELQLDTINSGIAFTLPLSGVNNLILRMMVQTMENRRNANQGKDEGTMSEYQHALIAVIVNRGFSGDVMEAARGAGARGGTVIHSHHIANEEINGFWGLKAQEEKDIVLIITSAEEKMAIMQSIGEKYGTHSEAEGFVMSMPIDSVIGI